MASCWLFPSFWRSPEWLQSLTTERYGRRRLRGLAIDSMNWFTIATGTRKRLESSESSRKRYCRPIDLLSNLGDTCVADNCFAFQMKKVGCCGSEDFLDYINVNKEVPIECRDKITGNQNPEGCTIQFSRELEKRSGWISGLTLFLAVFQVPYSRNDETIFQTLNRNLFLGSWYPLDRHAT